MSEDTSPISQISEETLEGQNSMPVPESEPTVAADKQVEVSQQEPDDVSVEKPTTQENQVDQQPVDQPTQTQPPAADAWQCPQCGNQVLGNFCSECGMPKPQLAAVQTAVAQPVPVPTQEQVPQPVQTRPVQSQPTYQQPMPMAAQPQPTQTQPVYQQQVPTQAQVTVPPAATSPTVPPPQKGAVPGKGKAIAALVCGILAIVNSATIVLGIGLGIAAIILAVLAKKQMGKNGMATAGLICGIVGTVFSFIAIIALVFFLGALSNSNNSDQDIEDLLDQWGIGSPITATVPGKIIANDEVCTIKLTNAELDMEGNLNIYFNFSDHTVSELTVRTTSKKPWKVNGVTADVVAYSWVQPNETKMDQCITIPAEYLPNVKKVEDVKSIKGSLTVDLEISGHEMEYPVVL